MKPHEHTRYTFEGISTPEDIEKMGYGEAVSKGDGEAVDIYLQIPRTLLEETDSTFDDLRMSYTEYMNFLIDYVYELDETEKSDLEFPEMYLYILKDNQVLNESNDNYVNYIKYKQLVSGKVLRVLEALEGFSLGSRYNSDLSTIIPSIFIKCIGEDTEAIMLNEEYYENLPNKDKITDGIKEHLQKKKSISL